MAASPEPVCPPSTDIELGTHGSPVLVLDPAPGFDCQTAEDYRRVFADLHSKVMEAGQQAKSARELFIQHLAVMWSFLSQRGTAKLRIAAGVQTWSDYLETFAPVLGIGPHEIRRLIRELRTGKKRDRSKERKAPFRTGPQTMADSDTLADSDEEYADWKPMIVEFVGLMDKIVPAPLPPLPSDAATWGDILPPALLKMWRQYRNVLNMTAQDRLAVT